ncbi:MAG: DUF4743 domain-containing protein [Thiolinea sp.]
MTYHARIQACNNANFDDLLPWLIDGVRYGWISRENARHLQAFPDIFRVGENKVTLNPMLTGYQQRTAMINDVMLALYQQGVIDTWVGEAYPVTLGFEQPAVLEVERAAATFLGIRSVGIHINGLVQKQDGIHVWAGRRTHKKPFWPGKLDQMVAGGQPVGIGLMENLIKESQEEASIPAEIAQQATAVSQINYVYQYWRGVEDSTIFVYDMWLPESFEPVNTDGEVEGFELLTLQEVAEITEQTDDFKDNCNLVNIDLLLRLGAINSQHPEYDLIQENLNSRATSR